MHVTRWLRVQPQVMAPCAKCVEVASLRDKVASLEVCMYVYRETERERQREREVASWKDKVASLEETLTHTSDTHTHKRTHTQSALGEAQANMSLGRAKDTTGDESGLPPSY